MRQMPTRVKVSDLRKGDRFSFIPAAWHGPGVVREVSHSGDCWCLKFSNWQTFRDSKLHPDSYFTAIGRRIFLTPDAFDSPAS